jgi:hypothetical protein
MVEASRQLVKIGDKLVKADKRPSKADDNHGFVGDGLVVVCVWLDSLMMLP